ncbi:MAG: formyltransferase family protein [Candidatus Aminicenantales bacterium]
MLLDWLTGQHCEVILADTSDSKHIAFPAYDLGISFLYTHRIPACEFDIPYKWVNFHPGPLPEFQGRNLAFNAILNDAMTFGATVHYMDKEFDTGEIIEVVRFPILPSDTAGDLVQKAHNALVCLFKKQIPRLLLGKVPSEPQGKGRYFSKKPIDGFVVLTAEQQKLVRALTVLPLYYAAATIGGKSYRIVPLEEPSNDKR